MKLPGFTIKECGWGSTSGGVAKYQPHPSLTRGVAEAPPRGGAFIRLGKAKVHKGQEGNTR